MKFSFSLLKKYLDTDLSFVKILDILNRIGFEVEGYVVGDSGFKIVKIISVCKHENADRLKVCVVYDGNKNLQIVCGAENTYVGMKTVLANVGAIIPGGNVIKESKIRGVDSYGMLCSKEELGLDRDSGGIIDLVDATEDDIGMQFFDSVAELSVTPNRGYALSIIGIARDVAAAGGGKLINVPTNSDFLMGANFSNKNSDIEVIIDEKCRCMFYAFKVIKGIKNVKSPYWLSRSLENVGIRSINAVVDSLHYITLLYGQPMHVYDFDEISGPLRVRCGDGSKMLAIDNKEYSVDESITVVADQRCVRAIAGIIGSKNSECSIKTTNVFLEAAIFPHIDIVRAGRKLNINTDSRYRFERKIDPNLTLISIRCVAKMITDICGGNISSFSSVGDLPNDKLVIKFDIEYFTSFTGSYVKLKEIVDILINLDFKVEKKDCVGHISSDYEAHFLQCGEDVNIEPDQELYVHVPSWMTNVDSVECIIGEIIRIRGYDKIISRQTTNHSGYVYCRSDEYVARDFFSIKGYTEVITWSFVDPDKSVNDKTLYLINPSARHLSVMRSSIIPSLLDIYDGNVIRGINNVSIFEIGYVFHVCTENLQSDSSNYFSEVGVISGLRAGKTFLRNIHNVGHDVGFFDIKSDVIAFLSYFRIDNYKLVVEDLPVSKYLHSRRQTSIYVDDKYVGFFGEIDPRISDKNIVFFEIFTSVFSSKILNLNEKIPSIYQKVVRDFSFVFSNLIISGDVVEHIKNTDFLLIKDVRIFDIYSDLVEMPDKVVIGFEVCMQSDSKTLIANDIDALSNKIIDMVKDKFGGILRKDYVR